MSQLIQHQDIACKEWWDNGGGFFGRRYMEGDDSKVGYLTTPRRLDERTQIEVDGILRLLDLAPGNAVLDCPCGYGRHTNGLSLRGLRVTGADINSEHLGAAAELTAGRGDLVRLVVEDMRLMSYQQEFDAAINMFFSFGFFDSHYDNMKVLENFYRALKPGGRFLMHTDVSMSRVMSGKYKFSEQRPLTNGGVLHINEQYDSQTRRINGEWILTKEGEEERLTPYSVRVFSFQEFEAWCHEVGFKKVVGYGDWTGSPLDDDSEDMMVVAYK
ncbi:MAG: class I SAM-dependent methyltransferase [Candidatus Competibacteraceae bacterium]|nr:class I SAM-dependent methyltransferase [Candidatus Competibacteraceae bacterium]